MSYCVGVRHSTGLLLLADTAVTSADPHPATTSSFGELQERQPGGFVWEGVLKLVPLGHAIAGAYAGNVAVGVQLLRHIRYYLSEGFEPTESLQRAVNTIGRVALEVKVLVAAWVSGPLLLSYNTDGSGTVVDETRIFVDFGSLSETLPYVVAQFFTSLLDVQVPTVRCLSALLAVMQSCGVHMPLMQMHVGGAMIGLWVDDSGVHWMPDTSYVLYNPSRGLSPESCDWIAIAERWGAVGIDSTVSGDLRVLMSTVSTSDPRTWWTKNKPALAEVLKRRQSKNFVFLSRESPTATVVEVLDHATDPRLSVTYKPPNEMMLSVRDDLLRVLLESYPPVPSDEFEVRLRYEAIDYRRVI